MTPTSNAELLERFYAAFARRDGAAMAACYAPDATFSDPVFGNLTGGEPGSMWRMLTRRSGDLAVELVDSSADDRTGQAHWVARYTFGQTGRRVTNDVRSTFVFRDGAIAEQRDDFDFPRWAAQALGLQGKLLGRTAFLHNAVRRRARTGLDAFLATAHRRDER
jgi:ketosteroid isomerase-like protein